MGCKFFEFCVIKHAFVSCQLEFVWQIRRRRRRRRFFVKLSIALTCHLSSKAVIQMRIFLKTSTYVRLLVFKFACDKINRNSHSSHFSVWICRHSVDKSTSWLLIKENGINHCLPKMRDFLRYKQLCSSSVFARVGLVPWWSPQTYLDRSPHTGNSFAMGLNFMRP